MNWFARKFQSWAVGVQEREAYDYLAKIRVMDSDEIAGIVVMVAQFREQFIATEGIDLIEPAIALHLRPDLALEIGAIIRDCQRNGGKTYASGVMVWLHSVRAQTSLEVRSVVRRIWGELERGFPFAEAMAHEMAMNGAPIAPQLEFGVFPAGLSPKPQ